jgi:hypothetical protein
MLNPDDSVELDVILIALLQGFTRRTLKDYTF